jgi:ATP-binding cassette subfamily F protein 3
LATLSGIHKRFGEQLIFDEMDFQIQPGEKVGLVGPNGSGKTSLFRMIVREEEPEKGVVNIPTKTVIGYFSQDVGEMSGRSVLSEVIESAGYISELSKRVKNLEVALENLTTQNPDDTEGMMKLVEDYGLLQSEFQARGGYELESRAKEILSGLRFSEEDFSKPVEAFSGGWKMRIALAKILLTNPDLLLMDEPTNHLDLESIEWLESWIQGFRGALLMTSHDREFMNRIVSRIAEVSQKKVISYTGNYDFYEREREIRREQLVASHKKQQDMLAKEEEFIARFAARASHAAQVQSRVKKLDKIERIEIPPEERVMKFEFAPPPRSGNDVVSFLNVGMIYGNPGATDKIVFKNVNGVVRRLDKIAVVGVNGAGKSTLLKNVAGQLDPVEGKVTIGAQVKMGYFSQHSLDILNPKMTVFEEVSSRVPDASIGFVRNLLGAFLFSGDDVHKKISVLSGGEKSRVVLACMLANPVNFLVLDEPTNHLDIKSREVLLESLKNFDGTIMIVSHDRYFLKSLVNRVFEVDKNKMTIFEGDYDYYRSKTLHISPSAKAFE